MLSAFRVLTGGYVRGVSSRPEQSKRPQAEKRIKEKKRGSKQEERAGGKREGASFEFVAKKGKREESGCI